MKRKPLVPRKEEYQREVDEQEQYNPSFAIFAIICLITTIIVSVAHEIYLYLSK